MSKKTDHAFARLNCIREIPIPKNAKLVLFLLTTYADEQDECYPSPFTLARLAPMGRSVVRDALRWLRDARLIRIQRRGPATSLYILTLPEKAETWTPPTKSAGIQQTRVLDSSKGR